MAMEQMHQWAGGQQHEREPAVQVGSVLRQQKEQGHSRKPDQYKGRRSAALLVVQGLDVVHDNFPFRRSRAGEKCGREDLRLRKPDATLWPGWALRCAPPRQPQQLPPPRASTPVRSQPHV
jgi:hypothetical protein